MARVIGDWCWDHQWVFGVDLAEYLGTRTKKGLRKRKHVYGKTMPRTAWRKLGVLLATVSTKNEAPLIVENARRLCCAIGLDEIDTEIFAITALLTDERAFSRLAMRLVATRLIETPDLIGDMLGVDPAIVGDRLRNGVVTQLNFINGTEERPGQFCLYVPYGTMDALRAPSGELKDIEKILLGETAKTNLRMQDFDYMTRERDFVLAVLRGAVANKEHGMNVLLYGEPGVGKTEFAKLIAEQIGCDLFVTPSSDQYGDEYDREDRLAALGVANRLARHRGESILLFDEMEDLLAGGDISWRENRRIRQAGSKAHLNLMLESNVTPIIWISNSVSEFDPAFLRRMVFSIEMKTPPASARATQWRRMAKRANIELSQSAANRLATAHPAPPSYARSALRAVAAADGDADDLAFALRSIARPTGRDCNRRSFAHSEFDLTLVNPNCDLDEIEKRLRAPDCPRDVSFCLYGPPGTGKSALARHFAKCIGVDILVKRGSDLLSPFVGETEQRIARAFSEAADENKLLLIDEAETLFWSREGAVRSWEASMVNEFLVHLEQAVTPVVCTTNHLERMDPAALRRFTFKTKLDYLTRDQISSAFKIFFDKPAPNRIIHCSSLTPGDFAAVRKQLRFQSASQQTAPAIAALLEAEAAVKQHGISKVGF